MKELRIIAVSACIIGTIWCVYMYFDCNAELDKKVFKYGSIICAFLIGGAARIGKK